VVKLTAELRSVLPQCFAVFNSTLCYSVHASVALCGIKTAVLPRILPQCFAVFNSTLCYSVVNYRPEGSPKVQAGLRSEPSADGDSHEVHIF